MATFATADEAWASGGHMVVKCTCGVTITQCRCIDNPKSPRPVNYVQDACDACKAKSKETR